MERTKFPAVFIHGMFGWGEKTPFFNMGPNYWPIQALNKVNPNYIIVEAGVVSSDHDRACEVFYQLAGGRVDYGKDHADQKGHARYGEFYPNALHPNWGEDNPIHLIGHSLGGTTAIELYQLLCVDFFGVGSNYKWVKSIVSIAAPLSGAILSPMLGVTPESPTPFGEVSYLLAIVSLTLQKLQENFPIVRGLYDTRMGQWTSSVRWPTIYNSKVRPLNSDDMVFSNCYPAYRLERNKHLIHMDKLHLFSIVTQSKRGMSVPVVDITAILIIFGLWKFKKNKLYIGIMLSLLFRRWLSHDWSNSSIFLGWLISRYTKQSSHHFPGINKDHWELTDGVVNSYSMICPRRKESTNDFTSINLKKIPSHISIDIETHKPEEIEKGQWHSYRVNKNHFCGTQFDKGAMHLYLGLFRILNEILT